MTQPKDSQALKGKSGLRRLINAFGYSREGIASAYATEEAFRQECWLAIIGIPLAFILPVPLLHSLALAAAILFLLIVEILNSAIEAAIDRIGSELHPLSKKAKDLGSAAVLFACALCALTWGCILWEAFL